MPYLSVPIFTFVQVVFHANHLLCIIYKKKYWILKKKH